MSASNEVINNYIESRITRLEVNQENIFQYLTRIEKNLADGFSMLNERLNRIEDRMTRLENRMYQLMFLFPGMIIGLIVSHALHWT